MAKTIDSAVFPGLQGGPHMNNVAGAAITFKKAAEPAFKIYAAQILKNARALAAALLAENVVLVTGGTDNHLMVMDTVASFGLDGRAAEEALDRIGITTNKQVIPDDPRPPLRPSGVRLGTPACTTRGMDEADMALLAGWMVQVLRNPEDELLTQRLHAEVTRLCRSHPVPGIG
jgi:glycine hydroxymethyltransferase